MASLLSYLGKRIKGALAEVNQFDNGETYNSVVHGAQKTPTPPQRPQPAQAPRPAQPSPLQQAGRFAGQANKAAFDSVINVARQVPEFVRKGQDGKNFVDNVSDMALGNTARLVNTANAGVVQPVIGLAQGKSEKEVKEAIDKNLYTDRGGLNNVGTFFPTKEAYQKTFKDPASFAKGFTGAGVGVATEVAPVVRGASLLAKPGLSTAQKVVRGATEGAVYGGVGTTAQQAVEQRDLNAKEILQGAAMGAAMGGGIPAIPGLARTTAKTAKTANTKLEQVNPEIKRIDSTIAQYQKAFDVETDPTRRAQINKGLANLSQERRSYVEGGYIGNKPTINTATPDPDITPKTKAQFAEERALIAQANSPLFKETPRTDLIKDNGRFIQSAENLPENASGAVKRQVQMANKAADEQIKQGVRTEAQALAEVANIPEARVRNEAPKTFEGSEALGTIESNRIDAINSAINADKTTKINIKQPKSKVQEYIAIEGDDAGKIQLKPMDDTHFMRDDGVVVGRDGKSVGTYVRVEGKDIIAYVGGKPLNITGITGDPNAWGKSNLVTRSFTRLLELNAPNKESFNKTYDFTVRKKMENEAVMKTELVGYRKELRDKEKSLTSNIPNGLSKKEVAKDIMRYGERKISIDDVKAKYGEQYTAQMVEFDDWARGVYDSLLDRANKELVKFGKDPVPRRNNYYTHFQKPSAWEKFGLKIEELGVMGKGPGNEVNPSGVRKGLPTEIAGQSEDFKPITRFNRNFMTRRGDYTEQDAFGAVDAYLDPIMFNIHMTEPAARVRVVEKAFRAADKLRSETLEALTKELDDVKGTGVEKLVQDKIDGINSVKPKQTGYPDRSQFVTAVQEYANALTGKTNAYDRVIMDKGGAAGATAIDVARQAQGIAGASSIPGNVSSALAQSLSLPQTIAMNGATNTMKGLGQAIKNMGHNKADDPMRKSAFMRTRYTDAESLRKGAVRKYTDAAGVPMQAIERAFGELNWYANYATLSKEFKGDDLIKQVDMLTEKTLAGRGIGDRPEVFRSTAANSILQFGLEVNNSRIQFFKEMSPVQKGYFIASAAAMNYLLNQTTGNSYLPDYIEASVDEFNKWNQSDVAEEDKKGFGELLEGTSKRFAAETAKFVPGIGVMAPFALGEKLTEEVFGKDSNVTRFGDPAFTKLPTAVATVKGGIDKVLDKDAENNGSGLTDIRKGIISVLPTGSQINKTIDGATVLKDGELKDKNGKSLVDVDSSRIDNIVKGITGGKYAINEIRDKYQSIDDGKTGSSTASSSSKSSGSSKTEGTSDTAAGALLTANKERSTKLRESMSESDYDIVQLSKSDRQKLVKSGAITQKKLDGLMGYYDNKKKELGYSETTATTPKTYQQKFEEAQTDFEKNKDTYSPIERSKKEKNLRFLTIQKEYDNDVVSLYGMTKGDVFGFVSSDKDGKAWVDKIVKYGDELVAAGLITKNKYRDKYGKLLLNDGDTVSGKKATATKKASTAKAKKDTTSGKALVSLQTSLNKIKTPKTTGMKTASISNIPKAPQLKKKALKKFAVKGAKLSTKAKKITSKKA